MATALEKLISSSTSSLGTAMPVLEPGLRARAGGVADELEGLLRRRNGFYAFESALHVFPIGTGAPGRDLGSWNESGLWISEYDGLADGLLFFAEDVFGGQFALKEDRIWAFDPETGEATELAPGLEAWAQKLLDDYDVLTGYPLAHAWRARRGALTPGKRLVPKTPFVLGGKFDVDNLRALDAVSGMQFRASIAVQIRDLPDGAQIQVRVVE